MFRLHVRTIKPLFLLLSLMGSVSSSSASASVIFTFWGKCSELLTRTYSTGTKARLKIDNTRNLYQGGVSVERPSGGGSHYERTNRGLEELKRESPIEWYDLVSLRGRTVLDFGTGGGKFVLDLRDNKVSSFGVDIILSTPQKKGKNSKYFFESSGERLNFPDDYFDIVFSHQSMFTYELKTEYGNDFSHERAAKAEADQFLVTILSELRRVTKPGGLIRISPVKLSEFKRIIRRVPGLQLSETVWSEHRNSYGEEPVELTVMK